MSQAVSEGKRLGRYKLTRRLATGGMAEVWLARATGIQGFAKDIVIKTILPHHAEDPEFVRMFVNEALLASGLNHPNIVQIFDLGRLGHAYFIAMEYIAGRSLRQVKRAHQEAKTRVPQWLVLRVAVSACDALDYAHNQCDDGGAPLGIVHRDVTPENIMISFAGVTKVLDFGIAKAAAAGTDSTQAGRIKGKFAYLAPEQILGAGKPGGVDGRCDVYAVGVVLYELLTGRRPLRGANEIEMLRLILHEDPLSPAELTEGISAELSDIVMKALAKDPTKRYASALDLRTDLETYMRSTGTFRSERDVAAHMAGLFPSDKRHDPKRAEAGSGPRPKRDGTERDEHSQERLTKAKPKPKRGGPADATPGAESRPEVDVTIDISEVEYLSEGAAELIDQVDAAAAKKAKPKAAPPRAKPKAKAKRAVPGTKSPPKGTKKAASKGTKARGRDGEAAPLSSSDKPKPPAKKEPAAERETVKPGAMPAKGEKAKKAKKAAPTATKSRKTPEPSPASADDLGTGVPLSTGASHRGETKPSAGVPAYGDGEEPAIEVAVAREKTSTAAADLDGVELEAPESDELSLTPSPAGKLDLGLPSPATTGGLPSPSTDGLPKPATTGGLPSPSTDGLPKPATTGGLPSPSTDGRPKPATTGGLPSPSTDGRPKPATTGGLPSPSTDGRPKPATTGGLPSPSTDGRPKPTTAALPGPATDGLPKPATGPGLPSPSTDGLPKAATKVEPSSPTAPAASSDKHVEPAEESPSAPPSGDQITGDQPTPWDVLISRSRAPSDQPPEDEGALADGELGDLAEDDPPSSSHAWDMLLTRTRASAPPGLLPPFEDLKPLDADPVPQEPPPPEGEPSESRHMWDAVLRRGGRAAADDEPPAQEARASAADRERAASSADPFGGKRRLSVSAEAQAAAAFDEGLALMREGDQEGACRAWERAVELNPDERRYRSNLKMLKKKIEGEPR